MDKKLLDKVYNLYIEKKIGKNEICKKCKQFANKKNKNLINGPVPIFHIGKDFQNNKKKLLIVGTVAYGWQDIIKNDKTNFERILNQDKTAINNMQDGIRNRVRELFFTGESKYYEFLKYSLTKIYGNTEKAFNNIAITNFVHCNTGEIEDNLNQFVRNSCADKNNNGFIYDEIKIINPTHIIALSSDYKYTRFIDASMNFIAIRHPSAPGRSKEGFTNEIKDFFK